VVACLIGLSMKIVGILLVSALLIIPAATARNCSRNPEQMAIFAGLCGIIASIIGVLLSFYYDVIVGPAIIAVAFSLFGVSTLVLYLLKSRQ
jgi:zinc transport system permease protein